MNAGLFYRLLLSLIVLFLASTAVMAYLLLDEARNTVTESRQQQAQTLVNGLAEGSLDALVVKDYELLERWLKAATPNNGFAYSYFEQSGWPNHHTYRCRSGRQKQYTSGRNKTSSAQGSGV